MLTREFHFELPREQIAQEPPARRGDSRLLALQGGRTLDLGFRDFPDLLRPGDLLVLNDTRVVPARLFGVKAGTGGRVELLVERVLDEERALVHLRASKAPRPGSRLELEGGVRAEVLGRRGELYELRFPGPEPVLALLERHGHVPLPPYIERTDQDRDRERYQTVYARAPGAVAAPTAGLHFSEAMLETLEDMGVQTATVTLHVGAGTFQPVRAERVEEHRLHAERVSVGPEACAAVGAARARGGRVIAVGTTVVRALESAAAGGGLEPLAGETRLFIYPGYRFRVVDALLTNFHLPGSSLLMLVCAFGGYERVMAAYRHAVEAGYRFFSYGDAMWLEREG